MCLVPGCDRPLRARGYCNPHYIRFRTKGDPLAGGPMRGAPIAWLNAHVSHDGVGCLLWPFSRMSNGYGNLTHDGETKLAHRMMCEKVHGNPPHPASEAAHSCGRGADGCVAPDHLRWATASENQTDRVAHGTSNRGQRNGRVVLSDTEVLSIASMRRRGSKYKTISAITGVPVSTIGSICNGNNWSWLTGIRRAA